MGRDKEVLPMVVTGQNDLAAGIKGVKNAYYVRQLQKPTE